MKKEKDLRYKYKIIITNNQKEVEFIGGYRKVKDAYRVFNKNLKNNEKVKFPIKYVNTDKIRPAKYEIVLLELNDNKEVLLPNEYGKHTVHIITNNEKWKIMDKNNLYKEESFWYYGYHPKYDRKDVDFIIKSIKKSEYKEFLRYKNKIVIHYQDDIDLITCKCEDDALRLMNYIMDFNKPNSKTLYFYNLNYSMKRQVESLIHKKTGWNLRKINRHSTRP